MDEGPVGVILILEGPKPFDELDLAIISFLQEVRVLIHLESRILQGAEPEGEGFVGVVAYSVYDRKSGLIYEFLIVNVKVLTFAKKTYI